MSEPASLTEQKIHQNAVTLQQIKRLILLNGGKVTTRVSTRVTYFLKTDDHISVRTSRIYQKVLDKDLHVVDLKWFYNTILHGLNTANDPEEDVEDELYVQQQQLMQERQQELQDQRDAYSHNDGSRQQHKKLKLDLSLPSDRVPALKADLAGVYFAYAVPYQYQKVVSHRLTTKGAIEVPSHTDMKLTHLLCPVQSQNLAALPTDIIELIRDSPAITLVLVSGKFPFDKVTMKLETEDAWWSVIQTAVQQGEEVLELCNYNDYDANTKLKLMFSGK
jgi:hypothetical protein